MILVDMLGWWYSRGWLWLVRHIFVVRNQQITQFFSVSDLAKTLFAPFRQDSLHLSSAPIGIRLQAFVMNIISRFFGLIIRSILILVGLGLVVVNSALGLVVVLIWPTLPLSPVVALTLWIMGVGSA